MSRLNTFYLAPDLWQEPFILEGEEAHHLLTVLRSRPGQKLRLIDGLGGWGIFTLEKGERKKAYLNLVERHTDPHPPFPLTLAVAWSKHLRRSYVLEKAVELGATNVWFWTATRSQGKPQEDTYHAWQRSLLAAAKQCESTWIPKVQVFADLTTLVQASQSQGVKMVCWEEAGTSALINPHLLPHTQGTLVVIGPEGGLEDKEVREMQNAGFQVISLGSSILRFETAAVFILSLYHWSATRQKNQIGL